MGKQARGILAGLAALAVASSSFATGLDSEILRPRRPLTKPPTVERPAAPSQLTVKFADALRVRSPGDLQAIAEIASAHGLTFTPLVRVPPDRLAQLEERAARRSGRAQPDLAGMYVVEGPVARLEEAAHALLARDEVEWVHFDELAPPPPCTDLPPATPHYYALGLQDYHDPAQGGLDIPYAWAMGARGQGVTIADCEYGWIPGTEDLCGVINEPGQTIHPDVSALGYDDHGSATLGEMVGLDNGYGIKGLVPEATALFFPEWTVQQGFRRVTAITNAIAAVDAGDVVVLEMQSGPAGAYGPAELSPSVWTVVRLGSDAGVIVVGAAGNGNQNLDSASYATYRSWGDSGAILVGGGSANTVHSKLGSSTYGNRINLQGWGQSVFTLGYGFYALLGGDERQSYRADFGGTSAATPFIVSAVAAIQSLLLAEDGCTMAPEAIRQLLVDTGIPQGGSGGHIGPFPDLEDAIETMLAGPGNCTYGCGNGFREAGEVCDGAATGLCPGLCAEDCTCLAFGPGSVTDLRVTDVAPAGAVTIEWTPACNTTDHTLVWGPLESAASYGYVGQQCGLGTSGSFGPFDFGPGSFYFIVVGRAGDVEGSYGTSSDGAERPEHSGAPGCDPAQSLAQPCE